MTNRETKQHRNIMRMRYQWHWWHNADSPGGRGKPGVGFPGRAARHCRRQNAGEWNWWWSATRRYAAGNTGKNPQTTWRYEQNVSFPVHTSHLCCAPVLHSCTHTHTHNHFTALFDFVQDYPDDLQCFNAVGWAAGRASSLWKTELWDADVVMCLGQSADLHMAQLMLLPLTISCSSKSRLVIPSWFYLSGAG